MVGFQSYMTLPIVVNLLRHCQQELFLIWFLVGNDDIMMLSWHDTMALFLKSKKYDIQWHISFFISESSDSGVFYGQNTQLFILIFIFMTVSYLLIPMKNTPQLFALAVSWGLIWMVAAKKLPTPQHWQQTQQSIASIISLP